MTLVASLMLSGCIEVEGEKIEPGGSDIENSNSNSDSPNSTNNDANGNKDNSDSSTDNSSDSNNNSDSNSNTDSDNSTDNSSTDNNAKAYSEFTFPQAGSIIKDRVITFEFHDKGTMWLDLGSAAGISDIFDRGITGSQLTSIALPENLTQLHAMLWTLVDGEWVKKLYQWPVQYKVVDNNDKDTEDKDTDSNDTEDKDTDKDTDNTDNSNNTTVTVSQFTLPVLNSVITERTVNFEFQDKGNMWLHLGTSAGAKDLLDQKVSGSEFTSPALPNTLSKLHATLWTYIDGNWEQKAYQWQVNFTEDNSSNNDSAILAGKTTWETTCSNSSCHSAGAVEGGLSLSSLSDKGIYNASQLTDYIVQYMPLFNAGACDEDCSSDVSDYIATWHSFPTDGSNNNNDNDDVSTGTPLNPVIAEQCDTDTSVGYQSIRLLTRNQFQHSVEDLLGVNYDITTKLPVDLDAGSFTNNNQLNVLDSAYVGYLAVAEELSEWSAQRNFSGLMQCNSFNLSCATQFIDDTAWKIIRRPFTSTERQLYLSMAKGDSTDGDVKSGIQLALNALLSSPQFLYRHEIGEPASGLGNNVYQLTQYELATFLSYAFSGTTPDATLLNAAKNNQLVSTTQIENQVSRLLDTASAQSMMEELVHSWLDTDAILNQQKDGAQFSTFNQVAPHMLEELSKTFSHIMLDESEKYESLYNADYTFLNQSLASHYKLGSVSGSGFQKTYNQERGGILLSGAFLSRWSHPDESNAITRAVHIRRDMLCQDIPNPPSDVSLSLKDKEGELADFLDDPETTQRMRFHRTTEFGSCSACHNEIINPLGFGLEDFNAVGIKRSQDANGNPIDANGALWSPFLQLQFYDDPNRVQKMTEFSGGKELGQLLATDPQISGLAKSCLAKQMLSYVSGIDARAMSDSDRVEVTQLDISVNEKNGYTCDVMDLVDTLSNESPRRMLERIGSLESIRYRKAWSR